MAAYDNHAGILAATVIMQLLSIGCVFMRFQARRNMRMAILATDWMILAALVCSISLSVLEIYGISQKALAYPLNSTFLYPAAKQALVLKVKKIEFSFLMIGVFTLGLIKLSVCMLYYHIFNKPLFRRVLVVWMALIVIWATAFIVGTIFECGRYVDQLFGTTQQYLEHCSSAKNIGYGLMGSDVGTDLITLIFPIPMIFTLRMPLSRKFLLAIIFMIGSLSVGAGIGKAVIYINASIGRYTGDYILLVTSFSVWNLVECQVGIIAACGPTLGPILKEIAASKQFAYLISPIQSVFSSDKSTKDRSKAADDKELSNFSKTNSEEQINPHREFDDLEVGEHYVKNGEHYVKH